MGEGKEKGRHMNWGLTDGGIDVSQAEGKKTTESPGSIARDCYTHLTVVLSYSKLYKSANSSKLDY